jgi:hypothetical protein
MITYRIEPGPNIFVDLFNSIAQSSGNAPLPDGSIYVGSGKAALDLILSFLRETGVLPDKMSPILMPKWLGTWVYAQTLSHGFPTVDVNAAAKVVICYHQYGFPQDMDRVQDIADTRRMVLIEDCAHTIESRYKGRPVGTFGEFWLSSFSKFAFCFALGAVGSKNEKFLPFVDERCRNASAALRFLVNAFKLLDEWNAGRNHPSLSKTFHGLRSMAYSRYGDQVLAGPAARRLWASKREGELSARRDNYRMLRSEAYKRGFCNHLMSDDDVVPYAVPLQMSLDARLEYKLALHAAGVEAREYRFDVARCIFDPQFVPCLLVPVHSGMSGRGMDILLSLLPKAQKPILTGELS